MNRMALFDKWFAATLLGFVTVMTFTCLGWWAAYLLGGNATFGLWGGFFAGAAALALTLRRAVRRFYTLSLPLLTVLYLLYMTGIFGFFMGVPVFNILPAVLGGIYWGRKCRVESLNRQKFSLGLKNGQLFALGGLALFCGASGFLALSDPFTPANLEGMLHLSFGVTRPMLYALIALGGLLLALLQLGLTHLVARAAYGKGIDAV